MKMPAFLVVLSGPLLCASLYAQSASLTRSEILGRLAMAYSPSYIAHLVKTRGLSFSPDSAFIYRVKLAGGDGILVERLSSTESSVSAISDDADASIAHFSKCAELIHTGASESAEKECRAAIEENPKSPWPLLVTAQLLQAPLFTSIVPESGRKKTAEYLSQLLSRAGAIAPDLTSTHNRAANTATLGDPTQQGGDPQDAEILENGEKGDWRGLPNMTFFTSDASPNDSGVNAPASRTIGIPPELLHRMEIEPNLASNHLALAGQYFTAHNFEKAQSEIREAIRLEPDNSAIHTTLGLLYLSRPQEEDAAIAEFSEAVRIVPSGALQHTTLAGALAKLGRNREAVAEFQALLAAHPAAIEPSNFLVQLYVEMDDRKSAIEELTRSLKVSSAAVNDEAEFINPRFNDISHLASLLRENHELDAATEQYRLLLRFRPEDANLHNELGNIFLDGEHFDEAIGEYNEALRIDPKMSSAHHNIGLCLARKKNIQGAIGEFQRALDAQPDSPDALNELAWIYATAEDLNLRNPEQALVLARRAVESSPEPNPAFMDTLAEALLLNGQPAEALAEELQAVALDPKNPELQSRLERFRKAAANSTPPKP